VRRDDAASGGSYTGRRSRRPPASRATVGHALPGQEPARLGGEAPRPAPGASVVDVTSRGPEPWAGFSPFYPYGGIPVPFSPGHTAMSIEGIWQGLKVFEGADVNLAILQIAT
jgi:hypothetical protein